MVFVFWPLMPIDSNWSGLRGLESLNIPHSSGSGGTGYHHDLALQAEELLERLCLWYFNHDCGVGMMRGDVLLGRLCVERVFEFEFEVGMKVE